MSPTKWSFRFPVVVCLAIFGLLAIMTGCESNPGSTSSGGDETITISTVVANPTSFNQGATTVFEATVVDNSDNPVSGVEITFTVTPTSAGYFTPTVVTTDANGIAATVFTANESGSLTLSAQTAGATAKTATVNVQAASQQGSGNLTIAVTPSLLTADGSGTADVVVRVQDESGTDAPDGTIVKLTAGEKFEDRDFNGYWSQGIDSLLFDFNANNTWDPIGVIPATATIAAGSVAVSYTAGTDATTAYVRATVNAGGDFDGSVETSVQLTPDATIYSIELSSQVSGVQVRGTGGYETTKLYARCFDANGNAVPEGQSVTFVITDGPGGGENIAGQGYGPVTAITNSQGVATVPISSGITSGTIRTRASSGSVLSNAAFVAVYAGPPAHIAVGSDFCNIDGWNTVNRELYCNAVVSDIYHNPVQDTTVVYFTVDEGVIDAYGITADSTGVASAIFRTGAPQIDGIVWVWAETAGGTVVGSTFFYNSYMPETIALTISPTSIMADGKSWATFTADVRDLNNNFVLDGTEVDMRANYGTVSSGATTDGCNASIYEGRYNSTILDQDFSVTGADDDGIGGVDVITAKSGFTSSTITITLLTGQANATKSEVTMEASVPYGATSVPLQVVVKDRFGNPLADHTMTASATTGTFVGGTAVQETNTYGEAFGFEYNAPADSTGGESAIITIKDSDPRGGITLSKSISFTK